MLHVNYESTEVQSRRLTVIRLRTKNQRFGKLALHEGFRVDPPSRPENGGERLAAQAKIARTAGVVAAESGASVADRNKMVPRTTSGVQVSSLRTTRLPAPWCSP